METDSFMKKRCSVMHQIPLALCGAAVCLAFASSSAYAQVAVGYYGAPGYYSPFMYSHTVNGLGFYLAGDGGISVIQDFNSSRLGFPGRFSTDPGGRFSIEPGFDFIATRELTVGAEFETGFTGNHISSITQGGASTGMDGDYYQVPFMGNLVVKFCPDSPVTPYLGVGGGGLYSDARAHPIGGFDGWIHSNETDPAVQGMAGIRFKLGPVAELGLGYKFLAALVGGDNNVYTHAVLASFSLNF
jgi:Outer membrane protein beta-barrel domain